MNSRWILFAIFFINVHMVLMTKQSSNLYAQDPQLFENLWYLHDINIDGESNIPPINNEIPFVAAEFFEDGTVYTEICDYGGTGMLEYIGIDEFSILEMNFLQGGCHTNYPTNEDYAGLYLNFWYSVGNENASYQITGNGEIRTLIITSVNSDFAIFKNEILLSIDSFSKSKFLIYPNPAQETLFIDNSFNQQVNAKVYDVNGKLLRNLLLETEQSEIDVKQFQAGLYFVVFENEDGMRVSKKFVKQ